jgi:hydrogenase maturation protease
MQNVTSPHIMVLGIGNILFTDEGFGVRVVEKLQQCYEFADNVSIVDGGVLGVNLMGVMANADYLIVVDAIRNKGSAGDVYRLESDEIPERIRLKNSLHQIDFLEALTLCQALDKVPETVILGVEPQDIETLCVDMSPVIQSKIDPIIAKVLQELERLGATYHKKE